MTMSSMRKYKVEILAQAQSEKMAIAMVANISGSEIKLTSTLFTKGYYLVEGIMPTDKLIGDFYNAIREHGQLAILNDGLQTIRRNAVMKHAAEVERCLRRLFFQVNELIEDYYNLLHRPHTMKLAKEKTAIDNKSLDPITSLLSFEEMLEIMSQDISWSNTPIDTPNDIMKLVEGVNSFTEFKKKLSEKLTEKRVWDVISDNVLIKPYTWNQVAGDINTVRNKRNCAAHFKILTPQDVESARKAKSALLRRIGEENQKDAREIDFDELAKPAAWFDENIMPVWPPAYATPTVWSGMRPRLASNVSLSDYARELMNTPDTYRAPSRDVTLSLPSKIWWQSDYSSPRPSLQDSINWWDIDTDNSRDDQNSPWPRH
jgi:hypothetical protein